MLDGFRHEALVYGSDEELLDVAVPFLRGGVAAGDPTLVRLPAREEAMVLDALGGPDGVTLIAHAEPLTPLSTLRATHAEVERLAARGARPVRMLGHVPHEPWSAWLRYEAAITPLLASLPAWGLCPYDTRQTPARVLEDVDRTHPIRSTSDLLGTPNPAFEDPLTLLEREARRPDVLERLPPDVELTGPSPATAGTLVGVLADATRLVFDERDGLRLAVVATVANAHEHGRPPVVVRAWSAPDRVVVTISDAGSGSADPLPGVLPTAASPDDSSALYQVREAVDEVSMFSGPAGFTVRLVQRRT